MKQKPQWVKRWTHLATSMSVLVVAAASGLTSPAHSATVNDRPLINTFDGTGATAGKFVRPDNIALDSATDTVYVTDRHGGVGPSEAEVLDKFNVEGEPQIFSSTGTSSLPDAVEHGGWFAFPLVAVDNSNINPGRIYVAGPYGVRALGPSGDPLWEFEANLCGIAVDKEGHIWVSDREQHVVREYASSGSPPAQIGQIRDTSAAEAPCDISFDAEDNLYIGQEGERSYEQASVEKYVGGNFNLSFDPFSANGIAIDSTMVSSHVFIAHNGNFSEYESDGAPVGTYGEGMNGGAVIGLGSSDIAYDAALDRVYLLKGKVLVFGPSKVVGAAPDLTLEEPTSSSIETAHVTGTINPDGVENSYHFEYKEHNEPTWVSGVTSTPTEHISPIDGAVHSVSANLVGLKPFTNYVVRLVATNDETGIENVSELRRFRTGLAAVPTIGVPSGVTASGAHIDGTIDPKDSEATWNFQTSADPECLGGKGFSNHPSEVIAVNSGVTPVEETLSGLLPNQAYCVRLSVANSAGTVMSEIKQFTTKAIAPFVEGRGAAPRTTTGARLDGFLNPENATTTYRFEYSDDGVNWSSGPDHLASGAATRLVSEEVSGLKPDTSYSFRFVAENLAGNVETETQTFSTLAEASQTCANEEVRIIQHASYLGSCRGIELVNNPDKGNQTPHVPSWYAASSPMSEDGRKVLWDVAGGAPGSPNGTQGVFLAERASTGWNSHSIVPPADQQLGKGELFYELVASTPSLTTFAFEARLSTGLAFPPPPFVLVRTRDGQQDFLAQSEEALTYQGHEELSEDGERVIAQNVASNQLEDLGGARLGSPGIPGEVVSQMPDGSLPECNAAFGIGYVPGAHPGYRWIAGVDASQVYFNARPNGQCGGQIYGLYVRNRETDKTTLIDIGPKTEFIRATPDGRHAYFITQTKLDPADNGEEGDVYRWDEESGKSVCLTCVVPGGAGVISGEGGVMVSDDFSHIYFVSKRQLVPPLGEVGKYNLYALHGQTLHFVGIVDEGALGRTNNPRLSPDGNILVFGAPATTMLTSDSVMPKCTPVGAAHDCEQLYRYDDRDRSVECLSCDHLGTTGYSVGTSSDRAEIDRTVSQDGSTVAFVTKSALIPSDVNQDTDIYEWRNGAIHLLTDGVSRFPVEFSAPETLAISRDGSDIMFGVVPPGGSITGFEQDGLLNFYDARIGGGFLPPAPPEECEEDTCQGPLLAPPLAALSASSLLVGNGNVSSPPTAGAKPKAKSKPKPKRKAVACKKGQVRKRVRGKERCVKRKARGKAGRRK